MGLGEKDAETRRCPHDLGNWIASSFGGEIHIEGLRKGNHRPQGQRDATSDWCKDSGLEQGQRDGTSLEFGIERGIQSAIMIRGDPKNLPSVDVPIVGFNQPVTVFVFHDFAEFPHGLTVLAPDTRHVKALATIEQGTNVYGSLSEQFFVCRDGDSDYNWTVLWVTLNAHQAQDSVQRLEPFCMLAASWLPDGIEDHDFQFLFHSVHDARLC